MLWPHGSTCIKTRTSLPRSLMKVLSQLPPRLDVYLALADFMPHFFKHELTPLCNRMMSWMRSTRSARLRKHQAGFAMLTLVNFLRLDDIDPYVHVWVPTNCLTAYWILAAWNTLVVVEIFTCVHSCKDRAPLVAHPPSLNEILSNIQLDDVVFEKDILAEQVAMRLGWIKSETFIKWPHKSDSTFLIVLEWCHTPSNSLGDQASKGQSSVCWRAWPRCFGSSQGSWPGPWEGQR